MVYLKQMSSKSPSNHVLKEMEYHDLNADMYIKRSKDELIWQVPEEMIFVKKYLAKSNKAWALLDLGCGPAVNIKRNIFPLMCKEDAYIGVDISKKLLIKAKDNIPLGTFINTPMEDLNFKGNSADYVCFFGSLHHTERPQKVFEKVSRFLKQNGILFLREPHIRAFSRGYGASPYESGLKPENLKEWIDTENMEILEWHYFNTALFHFFRKVLYKLRLRFLEDYSFYWKFKTLVELFLERFLVGPLEFLQGTDMFIVLKKKGNVK